MGQWRLLSERCQMVRALISQELDEELPEIGGTLVRAHLSECPDCLEFSRELGIVSSLLRAAPLEQPARFALVATANGGRRRRPSKLIAASGVASAAVILGVLVTPAMLGSKPSHALRALPPGALPPAEQGPAATQEPYFEQQLLAMLPRMQSLRGRLSRGRMIAA
jgi:hypothetical protein